MTSNPRKRRIEEDPPPEGASMSRGFSYGYQNDGFDSESRQNDKEILISLREQLMKTYKTEEIQRKRISELEGFKKSNETTLNKTLRYWNQFDEDCKMLKNRIDPVTYEDLTGHLVTPSTVRSDSENMDLLENKLQEMVNNSGEQVANILFGIQERLEHSDVARKALQFKESDDCKKIIQEECAILKAENAVFRQQFRHTCNALETEGTKSKIHGAIAVGTLANDSLELKEKILDLEWKISKLRLTSNRYNVKINKVQKKFEKYEHILNSQEHELDKELNDKYLLSHHSSNNATSEELTLEAFHLLAEIEKVQKDEEKALGLLKKLQFDKNNSILPAVTPVTESTAYKDLAKGVTRMEATLRNEFEELENLLGKLNVSSIEVIRRNCAAEKLELEKQSKTRLEILLLGERIEIVKQYLKSRNYELSLRKAQEDHFQPLEQEEARIMLALGIRGTTLETERDQFKIIYEEALIEREKLHTVEKEMKKRISDLEMSLDLPCGGSSLDNTNYVGICGTIGFEPHQHETTSSGPLEVAKLKSQLMKAKFERSELQFQIDIFNKKIVPNPLKPPAEVALKAVKQEISRVHSSIKNIKLFLSLQASSVSLHREFDKKKSHLETLQRALERFSTVFDDLSNQMGFLQSKLKSVDSKLQASQLRNSTPTRIAWSGAQIGNKNPAAATANKPQNSVKIPPDWQKTHDNLINRILRHQDLLQKLHREKVDDILTRVTMLESNAVDNIQTAYCQSHLKKVNAILQKKSDALLTEEKHQGKVIDKINQTKLKIERVELQKSSPQVDEVALEEIQEYKRLLLCSLCEDNVKDAIITSCKHVFCHGCVEKVKRCPKCLNLIQKKDVCKLYLV